MFNTLIILISVLLNASAQLFLKMGADHLSDLSAHPHFAAIIRKAINTPMLLGFGCYAFSILLWIYALSKVQVGYAYPFQALGYILVVITSYFLLHESLTMAKVIGVVLITLGVFCIARTPG